MENVHEFTFDEVALAFRVYYEPTIYYDEETGSIELVSAFSGYNDAEHQVDNIPEWAVEQLEALCLPLCEARLLDMANNPEKYRDHNAGDGNDD